MLEKLLLWLAVFLLVLMAYRRLKPLVRQMKLDREPSIIERIGF